MGSWGRIHRGNGSAEGAEGQRDLTPGGGRLAHGLDHVEDSQAIVHAALTGLQAIYRPGYRYAKAGVMLMDLSPADRCRQELLLDETESQTDRSALMQVLDGVKRWTGRK